MGGPTAVAAAAAPADGLKAFYTSKIDALELECREKATNLRRLEAQRNELNSKGECGCGCGRGGGEAAEEEMGREHCAQTCKRAVFAPPARGGWGGVCAGPAPPRARPRREAWCRAPH
jgi:hypothetical protein